jgi:hypothetical protein
MAGPEIDDDAVRGKDVGNLDHAVTVTLPLSCRGCCLRTPGWGMLASPGQGEASVGQPAILFL